MNIIDVIINEGFDIISNGYGRYSMICPFHDDENPSLHIYEGTNSWYCFGCQCGGDCINFIRRLHGISFKKAVNYLNLNYTKRKKLGMEKGMIDLIAEEEREGIDVVRKYGSSLINHLLAERLKEEVNKK
jgi:DNA primase